MVHTGIKMTLTAILTGIWLTAASVLPGPLNTILRSGDGLTTSTAFHTENTDEQYMVLRHLGFSPNIHALEMVEGALYDVYAKGNSKFYFTHGPRPKAL
jgi:hypothetical protein